MKDYTGFSSNVNEQSGNYLALKFDTKPANAITTVEIVGGTKGAVTLDSDRMFIGKISNKDTQKLKVVVKNGETSKEQTYALTGLTLELAK